VQSALALFLEDEFVIDDAAFAVAPLRRLGQIRTIVTINLVLGLIVVAIGSSGRYWG
jgi:uncharacterized membrane protein